MMRYARYEERRAESERRAVPDTLRVRPATLADRDAVAAVYTEGWGGTFEENQAGFAGEMTSGRPHNLVLVAELEGQLCGFARARYVELPADPSVRLAPSGWYLLGVTVAPAFRRRGVGEALTRRRLEWIAERAGEAYYFAGVENRASIALHERCGFVEVTRDFSFPGLPYAKDAGVLYRVELPKPRDG